MFGKGHPSCAFIRRQSFSPEHLAVTNECELTKFWKLSVDKTERYKSYVKHHDFDVIVPSYYQNIL